MMKSTTNAITTMLKNLIIECFLIACNYNIPQYEQKLNQSLIKNKEGLENVLKTLFWDLVVRSPVHVASDRYLIDGGH